MAFERDWKAVTPKLFVEDGTATGIIKLASIKGFKLRQIVKIKSDTAPLLQGVISEVGPDYIKVKPTKTTKENFKALDLSAYLTADNAQVEAVRQEKKDVSENAEINTYEPEPINAKRRVIVDCEGEFYGTPENPINTRPIEGDAGTPIIHTEADTFEDTTETQVGEYTALIDNVQISRIVGEAKTYGVWKVYRNSIDAANLVYVERTSFSQRTAEILFAQKEILNTSDKLIITFQAERYRSNILGTEADTFIRLEGLAV